MNENKTNIKENIMKEKLTNAQILEEKYVLEDEDPEESYEFVKNHDYADLKKHEEVIIESKDPKYNYLYAKDFENSDIEKHGEAIIESKDPKYNYLYARDILGANIKKHMEVIIDSNDTEYMISFMSDVKIGNKNFQRLLSAILSNINLANLQSFLDIITEKKENGSFSLELANQIINDLRKKHFNPESDLCENDDDYSFLLKSKYGPLDSSYDYIISKDFDSLSVWNEFLKNKNDLLNKREKEMFFKKLKQSGNSYLYLKFYLLNNRKLSTTETYDNDLKFAHELSDLKSTTPKNHYVNTMVMLAEFMYLDSVSINEVINTVLEFDSLYLINNLYSVITRRQREMLCESIGANAYSISLKKMLYQKSGNDYNHGIKILADYLFDYLMKDYYSFDLVCNLVDSLGKINYSDAICNTEFEKVKKEIFDKASNIVAKNGNFLDNIDIIGHFYYLDSINENKLDYLKFLEYDKKIWGENYLSDITKKHYEAACSKNTSAGVGEIANLNRKLSLCRTISNEG